MLKKFLLTNVLLAVTGIAFANGASFVPPASNTVGAFYMGVGVSRDVSHFKTNDGFNVSSDSVTDGTDLSSDITAVGFRRQFDWNADGVGGELFAGYGLVFNDHYTLAAEAFADLSSDKGNFQETLALPAIDSIFTHTANVRVKNTFGVSLMPGFKLSGSTNLYGRVGIVASRFQFQEGIGSTQITTAITPTDTLFQLNDIFAQGTFSKYKTGLQLGVGMETMVTRNVGIRGEYDWERYRNIFDTKPTIDRYKLAVLYHFYS